MWCRPASLDLPLRSALDLVATDGGGETDPEGQNGQEGCDGEAAAAVDALLRGQSTQYAVRAAALMSGDSTRGAGRQSTGEGGGKTRTSSAVVHTIEEVSIPIVLPGLLPHVPEPPWTGDLSLTPSLPPSSLPPFLSFPLALTLELTCTGDLLEPLHTNIWVPIPLNKPVSLATHLALLWRSD